MHISVGTFKRGLVGAPAVRLIMLESQGQFSDVASMRILRRVIQR